MRRMVEERREQGLNRYKRNDVDKTRYKTFTLKGNYKRKGIFVDITGYEAFTNHMTFQCVC